MVIDPTRNIFIRRFQVKNEKKLPDFGNKITKKGKCGVVGPSQASAAAGDGHTTPPTKNTKHKGHQRKVSMSQQRSTIYQCPDAVPRTHSILNFYIWVIEGSA